MTAGHALRRMALGTIYALGLRLGEGLRLETTHVDSERLMVWVRDGKGAKDRGVPLPRPLLSRLRRYWKHERPASPTRCFFVPPNGQAPLHETTLQKTFTAARAELGLEKHASIHTLRHSDATHLLEAGISLRTIQAILGHKSLRTTELYMHVTQPGVERLQDVLDRLMIDLSPSPSMLGVADVIVRHGQDYLARHGSAVPRGHQRALQAIARCRTGVLGGHLAQCACGREHVLYHSSHHRACPRCGHDAPRRWLERQRDQLLPVPYFHVVFTLPAELRRPVREHQQPLLGALFRAAFDALAALCADPRWLGGRHDRTRLRAFAWDGPRASCGPFRGPSSPSAGVGPARLAAFNRCLRHQEAPGGLAPCFPAAQPTLSGSLQTASHVAH